MPFIISAFQKLCQYILFKQRYRTGIKPKLFLKSIHKLFRKHHISDTYWGCNGLWEGIHIDHVHTLCQRKKRILRLAGHRQLRIIIILHDHCIPLRRPVQIFPFLGDPDGDTAGIAVKGSHMKHPRLCSGKFCRRDSVCRKSQWIADNPHGFVDSPYLFIGRVFNTENTSRTKKLSHHPIEIFRTGSDNDLSWLHLDPAAPAKVRTDRCPELLTPSVWWFYQNLFTIIQKHPAHGPGQHTEGKLSHMMHT